MDAKKQALAALAEAESARVELAAVNGRLAETCNEIGGLFTQLSHLVDAQPTGLLSKQLQEGQAALSLQYVQLQSQLQEDNRLYTAVSNIMKTKHDTVKSSIQNIR